LLVISKHQLQVQSDVDALSQVLLWFNQIYQPFIPNIVWIQCQTALAEGFTNAVRHAHKHKPSETPIDIEVTIQERSLEICIWDQGADFNFVQKLEAIQKAPSKDSVGGRGLLLLQKIADRLSYSRTLDHRNCLLIVKNYLPPG
jgi:serine/threonine-protein kinase RsbW